MDKQEKLIKAVNAELEEWWLCCNIDFLNNLWFYDVLEV